MSTDRKEIEIGEHLRRILDSRNEPLSTVVNMLAERYLGTVERAGRIPPYCLNGMMYENVLKEVGRPLTSQEIASFSAMCADWLRRNPDYPQAPMKTAVTILENSPFVDLLALVEKMERKA